MLNNDVLIGRSIYYGACLKIIRKLIVNALKLKRLNSLKKIKQLVKLSLRALKIGFLSIFRHSFIHSFV